MRDHKGRLEKLELPYHLRLGSLAKEPNILHSRNLHFGLSRPELFPRIENQMGNQMKNEMETGFILGYSAPA